MARGSIAIEADKTSAAPWRFLRILLVSGAVFVALVCLGIIAAEAWDYTNSVAFCANTCHDVHPEEPLANQDSYHARIKCTECHMGRVPMVEGVVLKTSHARHLPAIIFDNYERPLLSESMRPASESCEQCHFPAAFHDDMAREIEHFLPDADNTGKLTYLLLRTGAGTEKAEQGYGIHWHITNQVEYIATDETKQEILWVRKTLPDGSTVEYNDASNPLSAEEIAQAEVRTMDCVDCHNRIGHPFPSPEKLVDQALAEGRLSTDLPYAKREMLALLNATYATQEDALAAADSLRERYSTEYPEIAAAYAAEIEQAVRLARELQTRLVFEEPGVTWQSFPDNTGHRDSDGCFRCHDGQLVTLEGSAIPLQCNLCHSIPVTVNLGDEPPEIAIPVLEEPETHLDTRFVSNHRFQVDESCTDCHGEVRYGTDDSSFCANSACHGQNWPTLSLDENFAHPVNLEGQHAEATCDSCHNGTPEIPQDCAGCHAPPVDHLNGTCETCHAPSGWTQITVSDAMVGDSIPHNIAPADDCTVCHDPYRQDWPAPIDHISYSNAQCLVCHDLADPITITWDATMTGHVLQGEHVWVSCAECHREATFQGTPEDCASCHIDDDTHAGEMGDACADCHIPAGWTQAAIDHATTAFPLNGQHQDAACLDCHLDSTYEGTPTDCWSCHQADDIHTEQLGRDCTECHAPNGWQGATFAHDSTAYPLRGEHTQVTCMECHVENQYGGTPQNCYACHQTDDAHNGQLGQACAQCHAPRGWTAVTFDHNRAYPLTGRHADAACAECHQDNQYSGIPQNCYACHQTDDRHNGQFGQACAQCHTPTGWLSVTFDHNASAYPLTGQHGQVACSQCHAGGQFSGTPQNCSSCHQPDDRHNGQFGQNCAQCHSTGGWQGASFDHNTTRYSLTGRHTQVACVQCHAGGQYSGTPQNCSSCHQTDDRHNGQFGQNCAECHSTGGWQGASLDHNQTAFPLTGAHAGLGCASCHGGGAYNGTPTNCSACHQEDDRHNGQFGQNCAECHSTGGWQGASLDHNRTAFPLTGAHAGLGCASCHGGGAYSGTPTNCSACHGEPGYHAGMLGSDCASCHDTGGWLPARYDRGHSFNMHHEDADGSCRTCHPNTLASTSCNACHDGPPDDD